eukprot:s2080_g10.t1
MLVYLSASLEESVLSCFDVQQRLFAIPRTSSQSSVLLHRSACQLGHRCALRGAVCSTYNALALACVTPGG